MIKKLLIVLFFCQLSACSTIGTLYNYPPGSGVDVVYSGVKTNWIMVSSPIDAAADSHIGFPFLLLYPFFVVDLVLCSIADTLALPYTLNIQQKKIQK
jgi:uncharacterized protein YceK